MNSTLNALLALALLLTSAFAQAADKCTVQGHVAILLATGEIFSEEKVGDGRMVIITDTWQDCYNKAIEYAQQKIDHLRLVLTIKEKKGNKDRIDKIIIRMEGDEEPSKTARQVITNAPVFFTWEFEDWWSNTRGKITKYTGKYQEKPTPGDFRFYSNGTLLK